MVRTVCRGLWAVLTLATLSACSGLPGREPAGGAGPVAVAPAPARPLNPDAALELLRAGNARVLAGAGGTATLPLPPALRKGPDQPFAVVLSCADAALPPELAFDLGAGALASVRLPGLVADGDGLASLEQTLASPLPPVLVVVLGHARCGSARAACGLVAEAALPDAVRRLAGALQQARDDAQWQPVEGEALAVATARAQVRAVVRQVLEASPDLRARVRARQLAVVGAMLDDDTGAVDFAP